MRAVLLVMVLAGVAAADGLADHAKSRTGTWTCKGNTQNGDGSSQPWQAKLVVKLDVDNAWLQLTFTSDKSQTMRYRSYDAAAGRWTQVEMQSTSAYVEATSPGEQNGAWAWTGMLTSPSGSYQVIEHEQLDGKTLKLWGEMMLGGKWQKAYEGTCGR